MKSFIAALALLSSTAALATNGPETPTPSTSIPTTATVGNVSASAAAGALAGAKSSAESGTNSSIGIDASTRNRTVFIPSVAVVNLPSTIGVGNIIKETSGCGPLQAIQRTPVRGTFIGIFKSSSIDQGWTDDLVPYTENGKVVDYRQVNLADGSGYTLYGHQSIMFTTVVGVASNRNIAIGGGSGGDWGQGGTGSSSSSQRLVTSIQLRACELGTIKYVQEVRVTPPPPKKVYHNHKAVRYNCGCRK